MFGVTVAVTAGYRYHLTRKPSPRPPTPDGMICRIHTFDSHEGGSFRVSLTYEQATGKGKTIQHTGTYHGGFTINNRFV